MSKHTISFVALAVATAATAVTLLAFVTAPVAEAAPQIVKLERVVVTGKASHAEAPVVAQLPRVVVTGYSEATLARMATTLAAAKTPAQRG